MRSKLGVLRPITILTSFSIIAALVLSVTYQLLLPRLSAVDEKAALSALQTCIYSESYTEITDLLTPDKGVTHIYSADNGAGVVITVTIPGITKEHTANYGFTADGILSYSGLLTENDGNAELVSENILSAFTKTIGNYNTSFEIDLEMAGAETAREQMKKIPREYYGGDDVE